MDTKEACLYCGSSENLHFIHAHDGTERKICSNCQAPATQTQNTYTEQQNPKPKFVPAVSLIIAIIIATFAASYVWGDGASDLKTMRLFGAIIPEDSNTSDIIRAFTSIFVQNGGIMHLFMNVLMIAVTGAALERLYGSFKFTLYFLMTGIAGSITVLIFSDVNVISAGASGAGYGIIGLFLGLVLARNEYVDVETKKWVYNLLIVNIVFTFLVPDISIAAHLGGLVCGVIVALIVPTRYHEPPFIRGLLKSFAAFFIVIVAFIVLASLDEREITFISDLRELAGKESPHAYYNDLSDELIYAELAKKAIAKATGEQYIGYADDSVYEEYEVEEPLWDLIYIEDYESFKLEHLFDRDFYTDLEFYYGEDYIFVSGIFNGEIEPGADSYIEFFLDKTTDTTYEIYSIYFNDEELFDKDMERILKIMTASIFN